MHHLVLLSFFTIFHLINGFYFSTFKPRKFVLCEKSFSTDNFIDSHETSSSSSPIDINSELKSSFLSYAMSTILSRALPDARDGLKPVHRRVLFSMLNLNLYPDSPFRKCARIVGEVLGKYHPHGDQSVYDALVRMAQPFIMNTPLINGHGNFGSIDNDPPAAMRYTEAKLTDFSYDVLLAELKEGFIPYVSNFDGNENEPLILPSKLPLLLINGANGIAVGMSTNIPPHNLGEVIDALIMLIRQPNSTIEAIQSILPAPDFPTGGLIITNTDSNNFYSSGHGSFLLRSKTHIESINQGLKNSNRTKNAIIVTELPYMTNKAALLETIAKLVNDKKIEGISDLRDESNRDGIRIVIELKKEALPDVVLNNLFVKSGLQVNFSGNLLALTENGSQPKRLSIKEALFLFIKFRYDIIKLRTQYRLTKLESRLHIVNGLLTSLGKLNSIIKLIKSSHSMEDIKKQLSDKPFNFTYQQSEAILGLTLKKLSSLEKQKLEDEKIDLKNSINFHQNILNSDDAIYQILINESLEIKSKFSTPRKTQIVLNTKPLKDEDLIPNDQSVVIISNVGYIKRLPIAVFEAQSRGGKGKTGTKLISEEDEVGQFFVCNSHDSILFITTKGISYNIKAHKIPESSRYSRGIPIPQVVPIKSDEVISSVIPINSFENEKSLVLLTTNGYIKRTPLKAFENISSRGLKIMNLAQNEKLKWTRLFDLNQDILIATNQGFIARISGDSLSSLGRSAHGVKAIKMRNEDFVIDMDIVHNNKTNENYLLAITSLGFGKRLILNDFNVHRRLAKGKPAIRFKTNEDHLCALRVCKETDEVVLSTKNGAIMRQPITPISVKPRRSPGVKIQQLDPEDKIVHVDIV